MKLTIRKYRKKRIAVGAALLLLALLLGIGSDARVYAEGEMSTSFAVSASSRLSDKTTIAYTAVLPAPPLSDDGMLYLFELQPSEYAVSPAAVPVASALVSLTPSFTLSFTEARLYTKLGLAVKSGGQNVLIAHPQYIANPELLAIYTKERSVRPLKSEHGKIGRAHV